MGSWFSMEAVGTSLYLMYRARNRIPLLGRCGSEREDVVGILDVES